MNKQNFSYVLRCVSFPILNYSSRVDSEQPSIAVTDNYNQSIIKKKSGDSNMDRTGDYIDKKTQIP